MDREDRHHLFSTTEIRIRLMEIFGEPKTKEEKRFLKLETRKVHRGMPVYKLKRSTHEAIHKRFQQWQKIMTLFRQYDPPVPIASNPCKKSDIQAREIAAKENHKDRLPNAR
jgi:hypothetical protein